MSIRFTAKARRGTVALTVAAGLVLGMAGCGGGGGDDDKPTPSASASKDGGSKPSAQEGQSETPLAELKGTGGLLLQITSAARDSGGFLTVNGVVKNDGDKSAVVPLRRAATRRRSSRTGPRSVVPPSWMPRGRSATTRSATRRGAR